MADPLSPQQIPGAHGIAEGQQPPAPMAVVAADPAAHQASMAIQHLSIG